ncbi:MAG: hypothetical protein ACXAC7_22990 [Candidatus Hodarchaeales archaeon]
MLIWSKNKETGKQFRIETHIEISQEQVEEWAMKEYSEDYLLDKDKEYWAELDETTH